MKNQLVISFLISMASVVAHAVKIDSAYEERILKACISSIEKKGKKITDYKNVCKCIATSHYQSATKEPKVAEGQRHVEWITKFYETTDAKALQSLVDNDPSLSSFDEMVVEDCLKRKK